jgi:hypothetical protein
MKEEGNKERTKKEVSIERKKEERKKKRKKETVPCTIYGFFLLHTFPAVRVCCLLTPCSRVLLEKLTGLQLVKKFPAFYGTRRFFTALTSPRHLSLS